MLTKYNSIPARSDLLVLKGAEAILQHTPLLEELAARCDQSGAMHWLRYFLTAPSFLAKTPYLVLLLAPESPFAASCGASCSANFDPPIRLRVEDLHAAAILFEYRVLGLRTRAFTTDDVSGFRTVIAPPAQRAQAAAIAAEAMLDRGAQFVLVSYCDATGPAEDPPLLPAPQLTPRFKLNWARRHRRVEKTLPLAATYDDTLATLGKSTRFNLRYHRKRLLNNIPCEFVADARDLLSGPALAALNAASLNPLAPANFALQYRSACDLPGGFVVGLRGPQGEWLSLVGGWRQHGVTVLHWQMNAAGYEKDSLGTVMRSFFLEHEIERGARQLIVYGGTPHSMTKSFLREQATDLIVRRRSWQSAVLRGAAQAYCAADYLFAKPNFLAHAIARDQLDWQSAAAPLAAPARSLDCPPLHSSSGAAALSRSD